MVDLNYPEISPSMREMVKGHVLKHALNRLGKTEGNSSLLWGRLSLPRALAFEAR